MKIEIFIRNTGRQSNLNKVLIRGKIAIPMDQLFQ